MLLVSAKWKKKMHVIFFTLSIGFSQQYLYCHYRAHSIPSCVMEKDLTKSSIKVIKRLLFSPCWKWSTCSSTKNSGYPICFTPIQFHNLVCCTCTQKQLNICINNPLYLYTSALLSWLLYICHYATIYTKHHSIYALTIL